LREKIVTAREKAQWPALGGRGVLRRTDLAAIPIDGGEPGQYACASQNPQRPPIAAVSPPESWWFYLQEFGQWQASCESPTLSHRVSNGRRAGYDASANGSALASRRPRLTA
jgi:hypothetical protein